MKKDSEHVAHSVVYVRTVVASRTLDSWCHTNSCLLMERESSQAGDRKRENGVCRS